VSPGIVDDISGATFAGSGLAIPHGNQKVRVVRYVMSSIEKSFFGRFLIIERFDLLGTSE
jgi:hypothetical protein